VPVSTNVARARGHLSGLLYAQKAGFRPADDPEILHARQNLKAVKACEAAERLIAVLPELTDEGRGRVVDLIRSSLLLR
jgi:hypothetical protein